MIISSRPPVVGTSPLDSFRQLARLCCNRECLASCGERTVAATSQIFRGVAFACGFATVLILVPVVWIMGGPDRRPDPEAAALLRAIQIENEV